MGLSLSGVGFTYASGTGYAARALFGIDLDQAPGTLCLVLGATGSGKSTLLKVAAGLLPPTEGSVRLDGAPLARPVDSGIGIVFQNPEAQLFGDDLLEDAAFGPRNLGRPEEEARKDAEEALAACGLPPEEFGARSPFSLSGGEARRAAIAGVLAMKPRYLLMDEPTAGLDARGRAAVLRVVEEAKREAGVLVVTHDPEELLALADAVVVLSAGELAFAGTVEKLLSDTGKLRSAGLALPEVVRAQALAAETGAAMPRLTLDPLAAAHALWEAREAR
jgi:energy-coupling factor transport system ATP-binding protein